MFAFLFPDDDSHLATEAEADREYARNVGAQRPHDAWILSDRDVWYRNPAYRGPAVPHPEHFDWGDTVPAWMPTTPGELA